MCTFSGLQADARVLIDKARLEAQSFRFNLEDAPTVQYIAKNVAEIKQKYTQKGGVRPFGISMFIAGFQDGKPKLYQTEPSGAFNEWRANAIGRNASTLREHLEKNWTAELSKDDTIKLGVETLLECVEGPGNMEICVISSDNSSANVEDDKIKEICDQITAEKEAAEEAKKNKNKKE